MEIEVVKSKDKYSFSLWFDSDLKIEYYMFRKDRDSGQKLCKIEKDDENIIILKRDFGSILTDCFDFAHSDNFHAVKAAAQGLCEVVRQGRGRDMYEPYMEKLFRIYNNSDNPAEKAVVFMIWHYFRVKHDEMFASMTKRKWKRIGVEFETYIKRLFVPFEIGADEIHNIECNMTIGIADTGSNIYTWHDDLSPLYVIYLPLLEQKKKHILTCKECGKQFVAKRIDAQVCSDECKRNRQRGYNQKHIQKVNENPLVISYKELRQKYMEYEKSLRKNTDPKELIEMCVSARKEYEQEFDNVFYRYKNNITTMRAVNNCIERSADRLYDIIATSEINSKAEDTL